MPSAFGGLYISASALNSYETAMQVTGNNLANINTPGYNRETVAFQQAPAIEYTSNGPQFLGQGVTLGSITRVQNSYLQTSSNANQSDQGKSSVLSTGLQQIDNAFGEPSSTGISSALDGLFNSFSALAGAPTSTANLVAAQSAGQTLASRIQGTWGQVDQLSSQTTQQISATLVQVDGLAKQIASINQNIVTQGASANNNSLLDQRDQLVSQLAGLVNVQVTNNNDHTINVSAAGFNVVSGANTTAIPKQYDASTSSFTDGTTNFTVTGGQLGGQFGTLNAANSAKGQLDTLANTLRTQFANLTANGVNAEGTKGVPFFNGSPTPPQTGAEDFALSTQVASDPKAIAAGTTGKAGDGSLAESLSTLSSTPIASLNNQTIGGYYLSNVTAIGSQSSFEKNQSSIDVSTGTQIANQISSTSGVSVDQEPTNMQQMQRAYEANAKMLTTFDQIMQDTLNMVH